MSEPFIGEVKMFGGAFAPRGWAKCQGQLLSIYDNQGLFSLLGTMYGGDGQTTFGLPDLQGRIPVHRGSNIQLGQLVGLEQVTLVANTLPTHTHPMQAAAVAASTGIPSANVVADTTTNGGLNYGPPNANGAGANMSPSAIEPAGLNIPHENRMPYLAVNFIIALEGIFPSRN